MAIFFILRSIKCKNVRFFALNIFRSLFFEIDFCKCKLLVVGKLGTIKEDECVVYSMSSMNIVMLIVTEYVEQK